MKKFKKLTEDSITEVIDYEYEEKMKEQQLENEKKLLALLLENDEGECV